MTKNCKVSNFGANFFAVAQWGWLVWWGSHGYHCGDQRPTQDRTLDLGQPRSTEWCHQVREKVKLMQELKQKIKTPTQLGCSLWEIFNGDLYRCWCVLFKTQLFSSQVRRDARFLRRWRPSECFPPYDKSTTPMVVLQQINTFQFIYMGSDGRANLSFDGSDAANCPKNLM